MGVRYMKGSCLCGSIEYEVDRLDSPIQHCSCRTCRKAHAAAFNTAAAVLKEHFRWLKGDDLLNAYESSQGKKRYFCSNCGSQLVAERAGNPRLILRVATLDENPGISPSFQIWKSHEVSWLKYGSQIPSYSQWEPGR
jgi:ADP-ribosyl-[dinitrogen reductase] hydrolase